MTSSSVCVRPQLDYDMNMRKVATHLCRDTQDSLVRKAKDIAWQASKQSTHTTSKLGCFIHFNSQTRPGVRCYSELEVSVFGICIYFSGI